MENRNVIKQIAINAPVAEVWNALTDPDMVRQYLFGANIKSEWKEGASITYWGTWQGKEYKDKGVILDIERNKLLRHTHWSSLSGKPDIPANYYKVTYEVEPEGNDKTMLTITQEGTMTKESAEHSGKNWEQVLKQLKNVVEKEMSHSH
jgi:uncharacterized protein YndB with AHSA1/START domain